MSRKQGKNNEYVGNFLNTSQILPVKLKLNTLVDFKTISEDYIFIACVIKQCNEPELDHFSLLLRQIVRWLAVTIISITLFKGGPVHSF